MQAPVVQNPGRSWRFWAPASIAGGSVVAAGGWLATSEHPASSAKLVVAFPVRLARDIFTAALTAGGKPASPLIENEEICSVLQKDC